MSLSPLAASLLPAVRASMAHKPDFVIYNLDGRPLGLVYASGGEEAVRKAEEVRGHDCLWDSWGNATEEDRKEARRLGYIT